MSKTYTLTSTACKGGLSASWTGGDWNNYYFDNNSGETRRCGQILSGGAYCATYYMFDAAILASLKSKTITSVKLTITVNDGTGIPGGSSDLYAIREKLNNSVGSGSSSSAWQGGSSVLGYVRRASGSSSTFDITLSNTIPTYGYVLGAYAKGYGQYLVLESSATLTVVTNETDYSYTLAYDANGGSGAPSNQTGSNTGTSPSYTFTIPNTSPTRTGYTFLGWSTSSSATSASYSPGGSITVTASGTTTLYAVWKKNTYTVSYNKGSYGSGTNTSDTKTYGETLTLRGAIFTRTGHTQDGWATSDGGAIAYALSGSYTANAATTLYPHWKANTYTVSYNANGGTGAPSSQTKTFGVTLALSSTTPTRADASAGSYTVTYDANSGSVSPASASAARTTSYTFKNWNTASGGGGTSYNPGGSYTANEAATMYAQWNASTTTAAVTLPTPTRTGYIFKGWYTAASGGSKIGNGGESYTPTSNITLYAQWNVITYSVSFNANGGSGAPASQEKTYNVNLTLSSAKPTRSGYSFNSWNTKADGTGTSYASGGTYSANSDVTLYAIWTNNSRTVTYNANGGTGGPATQQFISGSSVTLSSVAPSRTGHQFLGWSQSQSATTASYTAGGTYTFNDNVTLYAVWAKQTYTISFNANGGSNAPTEQVKTYGDDLTLTSSQPTRSGYTFLGWARSNTATAADYVSGATYRENGNATLYAVWSVVVYTHTLTYSANGGTGAPAAQTQTYSVEDQRSFTVTSDQPIKDGYAFLGWSNTAAGTVDYVAGDTITAAADKTIYAVWEKVRFTISYNANGGSNAPAAQTKQKNVPITITDGVPTKQDSVFIGWATDAQATEAEYHGGDSFTTDADTVLYAVWGTQSGMNVYVVQSGALVECDVYVGVSGEPVLCDVYVGGE